MFRIRYRPTPKVVAGMNPTDGLPEIFRLHRFREDRVPGGAADPLPYPTGEPSCKDHIPRGGDGNDRGEDSGRDRTSEGKLPSSAQFVGKISREELYEAGCPVTQAFDDTEGKDRRPENDQKRGRRTVTDSYPRSPKKLASPAPTTVRFSHPGHFIPVYRAGIHCKGRGFTGNEHVIGKCKNIWLMHNDNQYWNNASPAPIPHIPVSNPSPGKTPV